MTDTTAEVGVTQGRGAVRLHRATCRRPRTLVPVTWAARPALAAAVPATCCKPNRAQVAAVTAEATPAPSARLDRCAL